MQLEKYKSILWDFDGVIMDSMPIRDLGFVKTLDRYPKDQVDQLLNYHRLNGGLSRYVKFRYFFEIIREEQITEEQVMELATTFSQVMLSLLLDDKLLIQDSVQFIKSNATNYFFHIVSGSDEKELNHICDELGLSPYFLTINGSPTPKKQLIANLMKEYKYAVSETCLIGDSINDKEAALCNSIDFIGYNNPTFQDELYIHSFSQIR